jgi:ADP-ribose pyrophosphatase YjhB (NUDIX family)
MTPLYCSQCGQALKQRTPTEYACTRGHQTWNNPKAAATVIVLKDGKLLASKRGIEPHKGKYDLPGGFLEFNEQPDVAARREILEETGLEVEDLTLFAVYSHIYSKGLSVTDTVYICTSWRGTPTAQDDVDTLEWQDISIIDSPDFAWHYPELTDKLRQSI